MAFTSASKAGTRARITLLDLTYLCHADTSAGNDKGPKVEVLGGREPCTHRVSFQAIASGVGKQGAGSHSPCTHPPTCHHKATSAVPISKLPQPTKEISGEKSHRSSCNHSHKMVCFSKSKPERSKWCLTLKLRGHLTSWSPETTHRPPKTLWKLPKECGNGV